MIDLDAMDKDPWPTWPVDKNELRGLVDEIERLRERGDDWRAAMTENHDLWNENERLREKMKNIIEWCDKLLSHKPMPKPFADAIKEGRAALAGEASDDVAT